MPAIYYVSHDTMPADAAAGTKEGLVTSISCLRARRRPLAGRISPDRQIFDMSHVSYKSRLMPAITRHRRGGAGGRFASLANYSRHYYDAILPPSSISAISFDKIRWRLPMRV